MDYMKNKGISLVSTGKALPSKVVTNDDLGKIVDTSDEWIYTRTGIKSRYKCEDESCTSLAVSAARNALSKAGIDKNEIGVIVVATSTPDNVFPSVACQIQKALELDEEVMAFDLSAACTGFIYALGVANGLLHTGKKEYALVVGSEEMSRITDYSDRGTCILFGDGAGAAIVKKSDNVFCQKSYTRGNDEVLRCAGVGNDNAYISMKGNEVFRFAVTVLHQAIEDVLKESNMTLDDVDYIICHQANERIIGHVQKKFEGYEDKFIINLRQYGNTSAASIPITLDDINESGRLENGNKVIFVGFGAGLTWSGALVEL